MGLAIDGNVVHGIARGGQAFVPYSNTLFDFSKVAFETKIYFSSATIIGQPEQRGEHFVISFTRASDLASNYGDFYDCRIIGATYLSEDNFHTAMGATAGLYYIFAASVYSEGAYHLQGEFLIRTDQAVFKPSGSSGSSMMSTNH